MSVEYTYTAGVPAWLEANADGTITITVDLSEFADGDGEFVVGRDGMPPSPEQADRIALHLDSERIRIPASVSVTV